MNRRFMRKAIRKFSISLYLNFRLTLPFEIFIHHIQHLCKVSIQITGYVMAIQIVWE